MTEGWHRLHDDTDEEYDKVTSSLPPAGKKDLANKKKVFRMKPRAVLIIGVMIGVLVGFGIARATTNFTINGPPASAGVTITPSPLTFNSVSMNWATNVLSISLTSTGAVSGSCSATFNPGAVATTITFSFTAAGGPTTFTSSPLTFTQTPTSISIQC